MEKKWEFERDRTALIVVDMQNYFVLEGAGVEVPMARPQVPLIKSLISKCRELGVPVIYTMHITDPRYNPLEVAHNPWFEGGLAVDGTEEARIIDELAPEPGDAVVKKRRPSAFFNSELDTILANIRGKEKPVDTVIICGTATNICCDSTARDAYFRDYKVVFGTDICSATSEEQQIATMQNMEFFCRTMDCAAIIEALEKGRG